MAIGFWRCAQESPDWIAAIEADGTEHTAGDLLGRVNQITHGLRARGLRTGDGIAAVLPNGVPPLELYLAALQAGWYLTPINWHFTAPEMAYIVRDCEAKAFFVHERFAAVATDAADLAHLPPGARFSYGEVPGFTSVEALRDGQPVSLPADRTAGTTMHYTSGTTGRPKGVQPPRCRTWTPDVAVELSRRCCCHSCSGITAGAPNVAPGHLKPNYHTAVTGSSAAVPCIWGTRWVYMPDTWDAERALALVDAVQGHQLAHGADPQFKRMLSLPEETRARY